MYIVKRGGRKEEVHLDKITSRIQKLCYGLNAEYIDPVPITLKVIQGLYPGITTTELDSLAAEIAATLTIQHPDYVILAARIAISNLHKETKKQFSEVVDLLYNSPTNKLTGERTPLISDEHYKIVMSNSERLNSCIIYDRDFSFDYFAFKVLEGSYLLRVNGKIVERPQHMLMRVAIGVHGDDIDSAIEMYNLMSEKYFIPSSTTLYAAATPKAKLCPSYSLMMPDDSIEGIFTCVAQCAYIAKGGAAVGVSIQNIRAKGSYIAGTNGVSNGLVPMLRVFNHTAQLVDEESNRRKGVISIYLEPWHADIFDVLSLKKGSGKEEVRARELSYCLWVPDLFMKRVEANGIWSLMCPQQCEDLINSWGKDFEILYEKYEAAGYYLRQIPAQELWKAIIVSQVETGMPHIMYKDTCNRKSNQKNVGTIKGGGYCTENVQIASENEAGTSSLASIAINMFVNQDRKSFDFDRLKQVTKSVTIALNKIIDINHYSIPEAKIGALRHRPLGIGVQGLADTFILMRMPFDSDEAANLNKQIFETIYYAALEASCELAEKFSTYETYDGSPLSQGVFQFDMCDVKPNLWDWESLKQKIAQYGVRNSLLISCMPTSTTSQIFSNNPSIEPLRSNIFTRRVTSGEFQVVNEHLLRDLTDRGIWDDAMKDSIISNNGSIQNIPNMPEDLKKIYKTVWEISQKVVINMAADRGAFIDQSQSLNIHIENLNYGTLSSMHFYGWKKGLKTGMYYLKTKSGMKSVELSKTAVSKVIKENGVNDHVSNGDKLESPDVEVDKNMSALVCSLQNPESCEMCGA